MNNVINKLVLLSCIAAGSCIQSMEQRVESFPLPYELKEHIGTLTFEAGLGYDFYPPKKIKTFLNEKEKRNSCIFLS